MKNLIKLCLALPFLIQLSCGLHGDNIHLSEKEFVFNAEGDSAVVTTKGTSWYIVELKIDSTRYYDFRYSHSDESYTIIWGDLHVEKRNNQTLFIKTAQNPSRHKRTFQIVLESGDYFDYININQLVLN